MDAAGEYLLMITQKLRMFLHLKDAPPLRGTKTPHAHAGLHGLAMKVWHAAEILGSRAIHHRDL